MSRRRLAALAVVALVAVVAAFVLVRGGDGAGGDLRVDAIFDTAKGVRPGQVVKIAGAQVGTIEAVSLTRDFKARVRMEIEPRFAPFRSDARCSIKPEGLIGERFVQCTPGTPEGKPLRGRDGAPPVVSVKRTSVPVDLTDLFRVFNAPARDRAGIVIATLGLGLAGRGEDVNELLRRTNPALSAVERTLDKLATQRRELSVSVAATDRVVAELARRRGRVRDFVVDADRVTRTTAGRRGELAEAVRRAPALLDQAQPALEQLDALAGEATPVLGDLRASAPSLRATAERLGPFSERALTTVRDLRAVAPRARRAARAAPPVLSDLRRFAAAAGPTGRDLAALVVDLRDRGFVESLLALTYRLTSSTARFDEISHLFPVSLFINPAGGCSLLATRPAEDCRANYAPPAAKRRARARARREVPSRAEHPAPEPEAEAAPPSPRAPEPPVTKPQAPALPATPKLPDPPPVDGTPADRLLDFLLG